MDTPKRIASFEVNHDYIVPNIYISRTDGDITTYDLRTRRPNGGDYMDNITMHSVEHMLATYIRSSAIGGDVIYFGPMGCRTGFYLLVRNADDNKVLCALIDSLEKTVNHKGEIFGKSRVECGNYLELDIDFAKRECSLYLDTLRSTDKHFVYPKG